MGNDSTKPNENIYFKCRKEAALYDERLRSRESAADLLGVSSSSLADYELGNTKVVPVDKVNLMADLYNAPQLRTMYCKHDCPIGDCLTLATEIPSLETVVLRLLNNLEDGKLTEVKRQLVNIAATEGLSTKNVHSIDEILQYGTSRPIVFKGTVSNVQESLDGADRLIEIEAVDGFAQLSETVVSISYGGKIATAKILQDAAAKLNLPVTYSATAQEILEKSYFSNGYSFVGYAQYVLDDVCNKASLMWSIQNGVLQIRRKNEGVSTAVHKLNKETGLINIPKRVYSSQTANTDTSSDTTADMLYGYEIEYFMNGAIGIGDRVYVESKIVTGMFMVSSITIEGDNLEGNWQCTAQITEVA